jgi:dihydrofolate synthase/folylpolyglutamate synthase
VAKVAADVGSAPVWRVARDAADELSAIERHGHAPIGVVPLTPERLRIALPGGTVVEARPSLSGAHQRDNAALAAGLAQLVAARWPRIDAATIAEGLETAHWPGRLETLMHGDVEVLLDCAHNVEATAVLCASIAALPPARTLLVFGAMQDKPWSAMLERLAPIADARFYCAPLEALAGRGPAPLEALQACAPGRALPRPDEALSAALAAARPGDRVLVTGSIFLVGAARAKLLQLPRDVVVPL